MTHQASSSQFRLFTYFLLLLANLATPFTSHSARRPTTVDTVRFLRQSTFGPTVAMGVANQVVTFTLSDFSRTFVPNGNVGSDHAWGSHHFVVGGSVHGGDCYGVPGPNGKVFQTLAAAGPNDTDSGGSARGRWIPTTAMDQYGATLASWFGVSNADLPAVFPNIGNFGAANLGFLS